MIYAIVRTGGKQYRVEPDQLLDVDRLPAEVGATVELTDVLLIGGNGDIRVGTPTVEGARVVAEVVEHNRDKKIVVFKYKAKTRYRRRRGHRQGYTRLAIRQILTGPAAAEEAEPKPKRTRKRAAAAKAGAPPVAAKPRRTRRAAKAEAPAEEPAAAGETPEPTEAKPARRTRAKRETEGEKPKAARRTSKKTESD